MRLEPKPGSRSPAMTSTSSPSTTRLSGANSTHWASAYDDADGKFVPTSGGIGQRRGMVPDPRKLLKTSASSGPVIEAFETAMGVPMMGIQWHPECYLPGMLGVGSGSTELEEASIGIFEFLVYVAVASRVRRGGVVPTLNLERQAFDLMKDCTVSLVRGVSTMNLEARGIQARVCRSKVAILFQDMSLWSQRMFDISTALDAIGDGTDVETARRILLDFGVVA